MKKVLFFIVCTLIIFFSACKVNDDKITIHSSIDDPKVSFGIDEIITSLSKKGLAFEISEKDNTRISFDIDTSNKNLKTEGFEIKKVENKIQVVAIDAEGLMYGGLELAEQIKISGLEGVEATLQNPYLEKRGTKFNIPLDARTPSYTDASDTAQHNLPVMWEFDFWTAYIDNLARHRYNYISLWNLHPFPSMVKVPGYEEIALDDVHRSTIDWEENYHLHGTGLATPEILANPEIIKKITIDEKIEFWKKVMRYAKDRNIDFHIITWNIFTNGTDGKYGITDESSNEITKDYFRKSIKQLFVSYPDLAGIGLTTGENMHGINFEEKEKWAYETYAKAILEVAQEMPERDFTFIHRQHQTGAKAIAEKFKPVIDAPNIEFIFSFKYAKAHVFSTTEQHYHQGFVEDIKGLKTIWGLRNDDTYYLRWGAPDFVREFISNMPYEVAGGMYYGSDQWIWGREFLTKNPETPNQLEIEKHWYNWMLWGRLSYDPDLSNDRIKSILHTKFTNTATEAEALFTAWQEASLVYTTTTAFHWGEVDFKWYIEGCRSRPGPANNETGFHDVNRFITLPPHPKSGFQSIPDYVTSIQNKEATEKLSPFDVAGKLHAHSNHALAYIEKTTPTENKELQYTLNDIKTMGYMGSYYAHKIKGATYLEMYRQNKNKDDQAKAIAELENALNFWKLYTKTAMDQNINPLWTNRVGHVDWIKTTALVAEDIEIAKAPLISD